MSPTDLSSLVSQSGQLGGVQTTDDVITRQSSDNVTRATGRDVSTDTNSLWSDGCQVIKGEDQYNDFLDLVHQARENGQQVFPYTLVSGEALQGVLDQLAREQQATSQSGSAPPQGGPMGAVHYDESGRRILEPMPPAL